MYLRVFCEDSDIIASDLVPSWVVEGFIKQTKDKSQEDLAEEYTKDLIGRNLAFVQVRLSGKVNSCCLHDLLLELCIQESDNECFLFAPRMQNCHENSELYFCSLCGESIKK